MSLNKKQVRENFRQQVFARDGHKCLFCDRTDNLDAHHIISRKEFADGGYFLDNGATLCPKHHIDTEMGIITMGQIKNILESKAARGSRILER